MKVTVQGVESRMSNIERILSKIDAEVYIDTEMKGCLHSFKEMLKIPFEGYRLHLQDDVMLPPFFEEYLDVVEKDMERLGIDVLSLFAPRRKFVIEQYEKGVKYSKFPNYLWLQATVFSRKAIDGLIEHSKICDEKKWDDVFVQGYLKKNNVESYVHLPSIVQHNTYIKSVMGNANTPRRMSPIYDKEYILNYLKDE